MKNDCQTCDHKKRPDGGHCYMFRTEPSTTCMQHTSLPRSKIDADVIPAAVWLTLAGPFDEIFGTHPKGDLHGQE